MGQCLKGRRERPFGKNVHFHEARGKQFEGHQICHDKSDKNPVHLTHFPMKLAAMNHCR